MDQQETSTTPLASAGLALKAEVVFAWQLISRHRAPRLALLLVASLVALLRLENDSQSASVARHSLVLMAGILASVAASRVTSRGPVLATIRNGSGPRWVAPLGRLCAVLLFALLPVGLAAGLLLARLNPAGARLALVTTLVTYTSAIGSLVMAATPVVGASAAASLGLLACLVGAFPPEALPSLVAKAPFLLPPLLYLWNVLPLAWRVTHVLLESGAADAAVLGAWAVVGLVMTAWSVSHPIGSLARSRDP